MVDFCWNSVSYLYWEIFWSIYVQALRFWELFGVSSPIFKPQCWPSPGRFSAPCTTGWNQGFAAVFSSGTQNLLWADACFWENSAVCGHGIVVSFFLLAFSWVPVSAPRACLRSLPLWLLSQQWRTFFSHFDAPWLPLLLPARENSLLFRAHWLC